ncbi:MAG: HK97 gp10 family phage protein [Rhodobacteraceae bacterium]|nr:HK97 gp10 family phage protein [Paracoccaceae bacterium]
MVDGTAEFRRFMYQTVPNAVRAAARDAMEKGADELVELMRSLAPVKDGFLIASIGWSWGEPPKGSIAIDDLEPTDDPSMRIVIYAGSELAYYARWVEFGTNPHSVQEGADLSRSRRQGGAQHPGTAAHPFFFPAYRALRSRVKSRITRAINKAIRSL